LRRAEITFRPEPTRSFILSGFNVQSVRAKQRTDCTLLFMSPLMEPLNKSEVLEI
jgi:hypothetical protein